MKITRRQLRQIIKEAYEETAEMAEDVKSGQMDKMVTWLERSKNV